MAESERAPVILLTQLPSSPAQEAAGVLLLLLEFACWGCMDNYTVAHGTC
jgi:hypothetical protein